MLWVCPAGQGSSSVDKLNESRPTIPALELGFAVGMPGAGLLLPDCATVWNDLSMSNTAGCCWARAAPLPAATVRCQHRPPMTTFVSRWRESPVRSLVVVTPWMEIGVLWLTCARPPKGLWQTLAGPGSCRTVSQSPPALSSLGAPTDSVLR